MKTLSKLLAPLSSQAFFEDYWTQKVYLQKGDPKRYDALFNWESFNQLLDEHLYHLSFPDIRMVHDGNLISEDNITEFIPSRRFGKIKKISAEKINKLSQQGATLVLDAVNKISPGLRLFASQLSSEFGDKVQINTYCSWKGRQAFDVHFDLQEAFILQIEGSKNWEVYENLGTEFPIKNDHDKSIDAEVKPSVKCTLHKGDLLYIPRGFWHSALAQDEPSLHITVGVYCKTKIDFIKWVANEVLTKQEKFRKNIPLSSAENRKTHPEESLAGILDDIKKSLSPEVVNKFNAYCLEENGLIKNFSFPSSVVDEPIPNQESSFYRLPSQRVLVNDLEEEEGVKIFYGNKELIFRGKVEKIVNGIFSNESFTGTDVLAFDEDFDWEDIEPILSLLLREQVIYLKN